MVRVHVRPPPHPPSTPRQHSVRAVRLTDFNAGAFFIRPGASPWQPAVGRPSYTGRPSGKISSKESNKPSD